MKEMRITPEELARRAKRYCAYQERCTADVARKLQSWGADVDQADGIIALLKKENFLSDRRFAEMFVTGKINQNRWGRLKIENALQQKGIPQEVVSRAMEQIDPEQYEKNIAVLISRKINEMKGTDPLKVRQKILQFMLSKGYESELIQKFLNHQE